MIKTIVLAVLAVLVGVVVGSPPAHAWPTGGLFTCYQGPNPSCLDECDYDHCNGMQMCLLGFDACRDGIASACRLNYPGQVCPLSTAVCDPGLNSCTASVEDSYTFCVGTC